MEAGVVVVTYNPQINELKILLQNVQQAAKKTVIVDNGSNNIELIEALAFQFPLVEVLKLGENKGIGFAQNRGIEKVFLDTSIDAVVLFDHDSEPSTSMIQILKEGYAQLQQKGIKVGAVGPIFVDPRTNNVYPISVFSGFKLIKKYAVANSNEPIEASFLIASGSLIPRTVFNAVGGMNEGFFIDYIDIEWGFRAASMGYLSFAFPEAKMNHRVGDDRLKVLGREISIHSPLRRYYLARNSVLMLKLKHINWRYKVREVMYSISRVLVYLTKVDNKKTYLKYILQGWRDGLNNQQGKKNI